MNFLYSVTRTGCLSLACLLLLLNSGCAILERQGAQAQAEAGSTADPPPSAAFDEKKLEELSEAEHNKLLSEGYSQLYDSASGLRYLDEFLALKFESDATNAVITDLAEYATTLKGQLEQLGKDYPSLSLEDDGLPVLDKKTREIGQKERLKSLAPVVGSSGVEFERTLLLTQSGALNQLRYLSQAIAEAEKSAERKAFMGDVQQNFDRLYNDVVGLLNKKYFCPANSPDAKQNMKLQ